MSEQHDFRLYIEPLDEQVNESISSLLEMEDAYAKKRCGDGIRRNLWDFGGNVSLVRYILRSIRKDRIRIFIKHDDFGGIQIFVRKHLKIPAVISV